MIAWFQRRCLQTQLRKKGAALIRVLQGGTEARKQFLLAGYVVNSARQQKVGHGPNGARQRMLHPIKVGTIKRHVASVGPLAR